MYYIEYFTDLGWRRVNVAFSTLYDAHLKAISLFRTYGGIYNVVDDDDTLLLRVDEYYNAMIAQLELEGGDPMIVPVDAPSKVPWQQEGF